MNTQKVLPATLAMVKAAAASSAFYVEDGKWLRMQYANDDSFCCLDEDSGEEYTIQFSDLCFDSVFYKAVPIDWNSIVVPEEQTS